MITPVAVVLILVVWMLMPGGGVVDIDTAPGPGWATLEFRDRQNRLVFPQGLVEGTATLRWEDREKSGSGDVILITGFHPSPVLSFFNKLYRVNTVTVSDEEEWRMRAQITVHIPRSREYEKKWFRNMSGRHLEIAESGNRLKPTRVLTIEHVSFGWKVINTQQDGNARQRQEMFEATLIASEPLPLALYHFTMNNPSVLLAPLILAGLTGLVRWVLRRRRAGGPGSS